MARARAHFTLALALLGMVLAYAGCAHGSAGARQAEAVANGVIGAGYRGVKAYVVSEAATASAMATVGNTDEAQKKLDAAKKVRATGLQVLDVASDGADALDAAIAAAEVAKAKDYSSIIARLVQIGLDVVDGLRLLGVKVVQ